VFAKRLSQRGKLQVLFWMQLASPYIDHFVFYSAIHGVQRLNFCRDLFEHIITLKKELNFRNQSDVDGSELLKYA
jgi:hypothetical protein